MKIIYAFLLVLLSYSSYSQELVRVIDTVLVLDISTPTDITSVVYGQQVLSPSQGKVWKIQSLLLDAGHRAYIDHCQSNVNGSIFPEEINCFVELNDGNNTVNICTDFPSGPTVGPSSAGLNSAAPRTKECFENIMWINSSSSIKIGITCSDQNVFGSNSPCISDLTIKAYISILEFANL